MLSLSSKVYLRGAVEEKAIDGWNSDSEEMMQVLSPFEKIDPLIRPLMGKINPTS